MAAGDDAAGGVRARGEQEGVGGGGAIAAGGGGGQGYPGSLTYYFSELQKLTLGGALTDYYFLATPDYPMSLHHPHPQDELTLRLW